MVRYITRFTEETFAALVGTIFMWEAFRKVLTFPDAPVIEATSVPLIVYLDENFNFSGNATYSDIILNNASTVASFKENSSYTIQQVNRFPEYIQSNKYQCEEIRAIKFLDSKDPYYTYKYIRKDQAHLQSFGNDSYPVEILLYNCSENAQSCSF